MRIITHAIGSYSWEDKSKFRNIPVLCWDKYELIRQTFNKLAVKCSNAPAVQNVIDFKDR